MHRFPPSLGGAALLAAAQLTTTIAVCAAQAATDNQDNKTPLAPRQLPPVSSGGLSAAPEKPNVLFILADDLGWGDSSVYGSTFYRTPSMERLAKSSVRFVNAYSASPLCSPSRASIMSGQYPARHGLTTALGHSEPLQKEPDYDLDKVPKTSEVLLPYSRRTLALEQYTLAEAFRDAGYRTGFVGKWHMGRMPEYWPQAQGFEFTFHCAPDAGPPNYFSPYGVQPPGTPGARHTGTVTDGPDGEHIDDRAAQEAIRFMERSGGDPFFLCLWFYSVHTPFQAKPELVEYYKNHPDPRGLQKSPTYAAMVETFDTALGTVLDYLEASGLDRNTVIVFTSDNGGIHDIPVVVQDGGVPVTSNAPLKSGKGSLFEGGSRVPTMFRWPGVANTERVSEAIITGVDYYPTLLELCGIKPNPEHPIDGVSFLPELKGDHFERGEIFCFFPHDFSERSPAGAWVREGDWKLIEVFYVSDLWPEKFILINLKEDEGETVNLAGQYPERVARMAASLKQHYMTLCARPPKPNPNYDPSKLPVDGWVGADGRDLMPELGGGVLTVRGNGISTRGLPRETGAMRLRLTLRTARKGPVRVFWSHRKDWDFKPERSGSLDLKPEVGFQTLECDFETQEDLIGLRIDLEGGSQPVEFRAMELLDAKGQRLKAWDFDGKQFEARSEHG